MIERGVLGILGIISGHSRALSPSPRNGFKLNMFYVYILKSKKDDSIYTGYTNDLKRRFVEHNGLKNISTKHKTPFELVYYESYRAQSDVKRREKVLKKHAQAYSALKLRIRDSLTKPISG